MVWFTVLPHNYSSRLLSCIWHFLTVAPDEMAVYHFCLFRFSTSLLRRPSHPIVMLNIFSSTSWNPQSMLSNKKKQQQKNLKATLSCWVFPVLWFIGWSMLSIAVSSVLWRDFNYHGAEYLFLAECQWIAGYYCWSLNIDADVFFQFECDFTSSVLFTDVHEYQTHGTWGCKTKTYIFNWLFMFYRASLRIHFGENVLFWLRNLIGDSFFFFFFRFFTLLVS